VRPEALFGNFARKLAQKFIEVDLELSLANSLILLQCEHHLVQIVDLEACALKPILAVVDAAETHLQLLLVAVHVVHLAGHVHQTVPQEHNDLEQAYRAA